jgi:lysophospholipase L1-like esterase
MESRSFRFVAVGGSITTGYAADPVRGGWAALVAQALAPRFAGGVAFVNRGVSGTDSVAAAARISAHADGADLVVLEFAVNDQWLDPSLRRQAYEGCLRQVLVLPSRPRVLCLFLAEEGGTSVHREQSVIADHYGVPWLDAGLVPGADGWNPGDPIHPNGVGHARIAEAVLAALVPVLEAPTPAPGSPRDLRDPLYSSDWQYVRLWDHRNAVASGGWQPGSDVHGEWAVHGGEPSGWHVADDAVLTLRVTGKVIGVLYSESEHYRDLEAWVDDGPPVILEARVASRQGYLGWAYRALARDLTGEHVVRIRLASEGRGTGRPAHVVAIVAAGVADSGRGFEALATHTDAPGDLALTWTGRFDPAALPGAKFGWQLTRLSGRFTGPKLSLWFSEVTDRNYFEVVVDGRSRLLELLATSPRSVTIADDLGDGDHRLEIVKRSEGLFGSATLAGLGLAPGERWLEPGPRPARRLEFYGDSITAGACNEDIGADQYDTLATHDPNLSYGAIAARRLGAEIVNLGVSGTGLTCSWNPILMPDVWDRAAPAIEAPRIAPDRNPDVVVVNLGQNDFGFAQSQGRPFDPDYGPRLRALVLGLRARYPGAWIVGALGGMTGWRECEPLRRLWTETFNGLGAADGRVLSFFFEAASSAHPRVDVHALLAQQLSSYLTREVWPHLETPLH